MQFDTPLAFLLLLLFPLALEQESRRALFASVFGGGKSAARNEPAISFAAPIPLGLLRAKAGPDRRDLVLNTLRLLTFAFLVTALARPQQGIEYAEIESSGRDLILALDISGSMKALDFIIDGQHVERLTALKKVVKEFIEARKGDRIGLIVFGTEVYTQAPLTTDQRVLAQFVDLMEIGMVGEGTALGDAVAIAVKRIREIPGQSKAIVLVTDGVKTAGSLEPKEAAEIAKKEGIKVYAVGIGGNRPAPFRVETPFGGSAIQYANIPLDAESLQAIASITGGKFFRADRTDTLRNVYVEINRLEQRVERRKEFVDYKELFLPFLLASLAFFLVHQAVRGTRYLVIP